MVNGRLLSMTGFAAGRGSGAGYSWVWDLRSVNGKGFDLRLRLPDWVDGLEIGVRTLLAARIARGSVTLSLKVTRENGADGLRVNAAGLQAALTALGIAESAGRAAGFAMREISAADLLAVKGVVDQGGEVDDDTSALLQALLADLAAIVDAFTNSRLSEGAALAQIITGQLQKLEMAVAQAREVAEARRPLAEQTLRDNLARIMAGAVGADPNRVAQELALLAVKADVMEELDRLTAHIAAARALLKEGGAVGKKFDFLMQEFMREANTLCSKSGNVDLTRIGLDLKAVIDQMREQVQNVE